MNSEDLIALNEEIAAMARAGLPLDRGLAALARDMGRGRLRQVTKELAADLQAGHPLPEAIARQGKRVPPFYAGLIEAGVRGGRVGEVLATLTIYARTVAGTRTTIVDAIWYPAVILVVAFVLFGGIVGFVIPQYDEVLKGFGLQMPLPTQAVMAVGREPVRFLVVPAAVTIGGILLLYVFLRFTPAGRRRWARWVYAIPLVGTLLRAARLAAFAELLAILVDYEVPLSRAFALAGAASSDPIVAGASSEVVKDLEQGLPLGKVMHDRALVPDLISWMTAVGEQRGSLGKMLHHVAELHRRQVEMRAALLRSVLPPFMIIFVAGIFVAFFIFVLILPMIRLLEGLSK